MQGIDLWRGGLHPGVSGAVHNCMLHIDAGANMQGMNATCILMHKFNKENITVPYSGLCAATFLKVAAGSTAVLKNDKTKVVQPEYWFTILQYYINPIHKVPTIL